MDHKIALLEAELDSIARVIAVAGTGEARSRDDEVRRLETEIKLLRAGHRLDHR